MAKLYIVNKEGAIYKPGTILRKYDEGYQRQQMKQYKGVESGRFTFEDVGFIINHDVLDRFVIPMGGKVQFDVTGDGVFAKEGKGYVTDGHGKILGSDSLEV